MPPNPVGDPPFVNHHSRQPRGESPRGQRFTASASRGYSVAIAAAVQDQGQKRLEAQLHMDPTRIGTTDKRPAEPQPGSNLSAEARALIAATSEQKTQSPAFERLEAARPIRGG